VENFNSLCLGCMKNNGGEHRCRYCGYSDDYVQSAPLLPLRIWLEDRYLVGKAVEQNGEGVTYIGWDNVLKAPVRIREFLPLGIASRTEGSLLVSPNPGSEYYFNDYLTSFLSLARGLARMRELPSLFPVYDIFEANGTAYYVSEHVENITLSNFLKRNGEMLSWDQAKTVMMPVLSTVSSLHDADICHGGISPETLLVCRDGKIRLSGFGITEVRTARSEIEPELFSGFAAAEQYGADERVTPKADVYAFGAVLYRTLVGVCPPDAPSRISDDRLMIPSKIAQTLPEAVIQALTQSLQIMPSDRMSGADKLRMLLTGSQTVARMRSSEISQKEGGNMQEWNNTPPRRKKKNNNVAYAVCALVITVALALILLVVFFLNTGDGSGDDVSSDSTVSNVSTTQSTANTSSKNNQIFNNMVPDIEKAKYADVLEQYGADFNIVIASAEYSSDFAKGTILTQSPAKDTLLYEKDRGDDGKYTITITMSLGSQTTTMPNLSGRTEEEAMIELLKKGFDISNVDVQERYAPDVAYKTIVDTEPAAGTRNVDKNSKIIIYIQNTPPVNSNTSSDTE